MQIENPKRIQIQLRFQGKSPPQPYRSLKNPSHVNSGLFMCAVGRVCVGVYVSKYEVKLEIEQARQNGEKKQKMLYVM